MLLNNQCSTEEINEEILRIPGNKWKQKHSNPIAKTIGHAVKQKLAQQCKSTVTSLKKKKKWDYQEGSWLIR